MLGMPSSRDWRCAVSAPPRANRAPGDSGPMSRSAVREIPVSGIRMHRDEGVVPTQIGDAVHGMLTCHAAPLVAGSLRAKGRTTRLAELPRSDDLSDEFDARLFLATCSQQDGTTAAIA